MGNHGGHQRRDASRRILLAEIELAFRAEHLTENHDGADVGLFHLLGLVSGEELHLAGQSQHFVRAVGHRCDDDITVVLDEFVCVESR